MRRRTGMLRTYRELRAEERRGEWHTFWRELVRSIAFVVVVTGLLMIAVVVCSQ